MKLSQEPKGDGRVVLSYIVAPAAAPRVGQNIASQVKIICFRVGGSVAAAPLVAPPDRLAGPHPLAANACPGGSGRDMCRQPATIGSGPQLIDCACTERAHVTGSDTGVERTVNDGTVLSISGSPPITACTQVRWAAPQPGQLGHQADRRAHGRCSEGASRLASVLSINSTWRSSSKYTL
jgi:hypothetical protein